MKKFLLTTIALMGMTGMAFAGTGTLEDPYTPSEALAKIAGGYEGAAVVKGYVITISEISTSYGNATYTLGDEANSTSTLSVYRGYYLDGAKFTNENQLKIGDLLVVSGELVNYKGNTPQFTTGSKIISINGSTEAGDDTPGEPAPEPETPKGENVTFNFTDPASLGISYVPEQQENDLTGLVVESNGVSIAFANNGGSTVPRLWYASGNYTMRFYKDNTLTISAPEGQYLTGVVFDGSNLGTDWTYSNGSLQGSTWVPTGDINQVVIGKSATGNAPAIKSIIVYYSNESGVEEILAAEDSEAVYFNLQGQRVNNPERGIFIKVVNGKALKVVK